MENTITRKIRLINKTLKMGKAVIIDRETYLRIKLELSAQELNFYKNAILIKGN